MRRSAADSRTPAARRGFTLIELLMVIAVIGVISSTVLFAMIGVMEDAKAARTRSQIARINELLLTRWEEYRTRAVPLKMPPATDARTAAMIRLMALRDLMRLEMPDRRTDVMAGPVSLVINTNNGPMTQSLPIPSVWRAYNRRVATVWGAGWGNIPPNPPGQPANTWTPQYEGSECLYLILAAMRDGDSSALDFFSEKEIGDLDEDGMPEILDGWGRPLEFLRWSPGYRSVIQVGDENPAVDGDAGDSADPFDPLKNDYRWFNSVPDDDPFALYPLIYSAGSDGVYDVTTTFVMSTSSYSGEFRYDKTESPNGYYPNDPYYRASNGVQIGLRNPTGDGYVDNISNHLLED